MKEKLYPPEALGDTIHPESDECREEGCAYHNPTEHATSHLPLMWSPRDRMFFRVDEQGNRYLDPDEIAWRERHPDNPDYPKVWNGPF